VIGREGHLAWAFPKYGYLAGTVQCTPYVLTLVIKKNYRNKYSCRGSGNIGKDSVYSGNIGKGSIHSGNIGKDSIHSGNMEKNLMHKGNILEKIRFTEEILEKIWFRAKIF
jgi:hypothetical protein